MGVGVGEGKRQKGLVIGAVATRRCACVCAYMMVFVSVVLGFADM